MAKTLSEKEIDKIRKTWNKYLQKEMMWFFGIHMVRSDRAELSIGLDVLGVK